MTTSNYPGLPPFRPADIIRIQNGVLEHRRKQGATTLRRRFRLPLVIARGRKARRKGDR